MRRFLRTAAKRIAQQTMPPTAILPAAALPGWGVLPAWRALRRANPAARLLGGTALLHNRAEVQQTQRAAQLQWMNSAGEEGPLPSDEAFARGNSEELEELPSTAVPRDIKVVATVEEAQRVAAYLQTLPEVYHAIDTEVAAIDVVKETPVGHGTIICFSVYCGPEADFGDSTKRLWVDVETGGPEVLRAFKPYLENKKIRKVWHNYAFDKHIFGNAGIVPCGFGGDTMHMARLWDSSRTGKGYSLEALTKDEDVMREAMVSTELSTEYHRSKVSMKDLFAKPNIKKDGSDGKLRVLPDILDLQTNPETRAQWIDYSALDAQATWLLRESLECKLRNMPADASQYIPVDPAFPACKTMWEFYQQHWRPFGALLVQMERNGMLVDNQQLQEAQRLAQQHKETAENTFRSWASARCEDALWMNVGSGSQIRQLLFAGLAGKPVAPGKPPNEPLVPLEREFKVPNPEWETWEHNGREGKAPKKQKAILLRGLVSHPIVPPAFTASGLPSVSSITLRAMVGKQGTAAELLERWDKAQSENGTEENRLIATAAIGADGEKRCGGIYRAFGGGRDGLEAAAAVDALCEASAVDTLLTNFILPLQGSNLRGPEDRVHCSLNINTETGRLSARRPNLQNQPALEKDRYGIRKAFVCKPGNSLIVADYGQLELRLLAHMADCKSMLEAFRLGGDFHSRTALGMYPEIRKAVDAGACLLEWDGPEDTAPAPLLKNLFAVERRKAKILNFSIAYGKTKHGLAKDWNVSLQEAEKTVDAWYSDRPEVLNWQKEQHRVVQETGRVCTLLGRQRQLPEARDPSAAKASKAHALRAAINTPIQGGAADVAMLAMLELDRSEKLRSMGWRLLMQVHDEVILEGPKESSEIALQVVRHAMQNPFGGKNLLRCALDVSSSFAGSWYEAK